MMVVATSVVVVICQWAVVTGVAPGAAGARQVLAKQQLASAQQEGGS